MLAIAPWSHEETYPPSQGRSNLVSGKFGMLGGATPPLGILYISSALKRAGHQTGFVDGFFVKGEAWYRQVLALQPDLVGLWTAQFCWERNKEALAELRRRAGPGLGLGVGGTFITACAQELLTDPGTEPIDHMVVGDAEEVMVELCEALGGARDMASIRGLVWRRQGQLHYNGPRPPLKDLDAIPFPDYDLLDINDYTPAIGSYKTLPSVNMVTSRGCAGQCIFCHSADTQRVRSIDNVVQEITWLQANFGVRHLLFFDETFTYLRPRVVAFCHRLMEKKIQIQWTCNARVDTVDLELARLMKSAGCWRLQFGAESGVQKQLDTLHKGVTLDQIREAVRLTKKAGLDVFASFMFGIPGETYEEGLQTIRFAKSLPLDYCNFLNFMPLRGTPLWDELDQHGRLLGPLAFHLMSFVPHSMTPEQLADLMVRGPREYYFRPSYMIRRFLAQRSMEDIKRNLRGLFAYLGMDAARDFLRH